MVTVSTQAARYHKGLHDITISVMIIHMKRTGGIAKIRVIAKGSVLVVMAMLIALSGFVAILNSDETQAVVGDGWEEIVNHNIELNKAWLCLQRVVKWKSQESKVAGGSDTANIIVNNMDIQNGNITLVTDVVHVMSNGFDERIECTANGSYLKANLGTLTGKNGIDLMKIFATCDNPSSGAYTCKYKSINDAKTAFKNSVVTKPKKLSKEQVYGYYYDQLTKNCGVSIEDGQDPNFTGKPESGYMKSETDKAIQVLTTDGVIAGRWIDEHAGESYNSYTEEHGYSNSYSVKQAAFYNNDKEVFNNEDFWTPGINTTLTFEDSKKGRIRYKGYCSEIIAMFKDVKASFGIGKTGEQVKKDMCTKYVRETVYSLSAAQPLSKTGEGLVNACVFGTDKKPTSSEHYCYALSLFVLSKYFDQSKKVGEVKDSAGVALSGEQLDNAINTTRDIKRDEWPDQFNIIDACLYGSSGVVLNDSTGDSTPGANSTNSPSCYTNGGSMAWILCPMIETMSAGIDMLMGSIDGALNYQSLNSDSDSGGTIRTAWGAFIPIANIAFAVVFLIVIYSTAIGGGKQ